MRSPHTRKSEISKRTVGHLPDELQGEDTLARQVSGNPFSARHNSLKRDGSDLHELGVGGGLFNNLSQLDEDTRKKLDEEYTR